MSQELNPKWHFHGGLDLADHKVESTTLAIDKMPLPDTLIIPLQQNIGEAAELCVKVGDTVLKGQLLARASEYVSASLHAPSSGIITDISEQQIAHPSALSANCITISCDGKDQWCELPEAWPNYLDIEQCDLRERLRWAGIVGLGGALFPSSVKSNTQQAKINTLIINAAECEPYISCDDMLMREAADKIIEGILILQHIIDAKEVLIGIEDNKPEAQVALLAAIKKNCTAKIFLRVIPTKYPSGGEKQLIYLLTGIEVPSQGLPADVGLLCQNVATCLAIAEAVIDAKPLISRITTVTGDGINQARNFETLIGTLASELIAYAGGYRPGVARLIQGGPMMGFSLASDEVPLTKASNCLLATTETTTPKKQQASACIRCGNCVEVCPAKLLPQQLYWHAKARDLDKAQSHNLFDCIECGCCDQVCPSQIPLVQYYRFAKTEVRASEREQRQSDLARRRFEARDARLERLAAERKSRLRKKKEALDKKPKSKADPKKAAIEAAMKRVAAKKAAQQSEVPDQKSES